MKRYIDHFTDDLLNSLLEQCDFTAEPLKQKGRILHTLWQEKAADRIMPQRKDFSLRDTVPYMDTLWFLQYDPEKGDLFVSIFPNIMSQALGIDFQGKWMTEVPKEMANRFVPVYYNVCTHKTPFFFKHIFKDRYGISGEFEAAVYPLGTDDQVTHLMCFVESISDNNIFDVTRRYFNQL